MKSQPEEAGKAEKLAGEIRERIERGELEPGAPLPTGKAFRGGGVSVTTVRAARQLLREWGLVTGGRGAPLRVRVPHREVVRSTARHQDEKDRVLWPEAERGKIGTSEIELGVSIEEVDFRARYERVAAGTELAALMGIGAQSALLRRNYEWREPRSGHLQAASVSYLPVALIQRNPALLDEANEPWPGGTQHQLATVGIEVARVVERTVGRPPVAEERAAWGMEPGDSLQVVRGRLIDVHGRVVEVTEALFPAAWTVLESVTELRPWGESATAAE